MPRSVSEAAIRDWCIAYLTRTLNDPSIAVGAHVPFPSMGLDSATSAYFIVELEEWLGAELDAELVTEHPTIAELAGHLSRRLGGGNGAAG